MMGGLLTLPVMGRLNDEEQVGERHLLIAVYIGRRVPAPVARAREQRPRDDGDVPTVDFAVVIEIETALR
jgi:hypothetical protein